MELSIQKENKTVKSHDLPTFPEIKEDYTCFEALLYEVSIQILHVFQCVHWASRAQVGLSITPRPVQCLQFHLLLKPNILHPNEMCSNVTHVGKSLWVHGYWQ